MTNVWYGAVNSKKILIFLFRISQGLSSNCDKSRTSTTAAAPDASRAAAAATSAAAVTAARSTAAAAATTGRAAATTAAAAAAGTRFKGATTAGKLCCSTQRSCPGAGKS